ncbi:hypothetical protein DAPPUDRAFT_116030 [Daphnia pulex]|uniref:Uncharacterized protein n=1 Tax=Daphnia pulex TaxID=6669 RepID=E9HNC2_DAPPU|nr:hypothetical protein DAPPUDRAFT_116030 [Daphnia pulex]|eukprot:EFX66771.1 hypothetical protein DAPPUDRAFT_116030 [Daphnia pulex]
MAWKSNNDVFRRIGFWLVAVTVISSTSVCSASFNSTGVAVRSSDVKKSFPRSTTESQLVTGRPLDFLSPRDSSCPLTKNELRQMDELLSSFNDTVRSDRLRCDNLEDDREPLMVSLSSADRCSQLKESILSNVNDLKMVFQCLKVTGDKDDDVYKTLKTTYETKMRRLQQQADSAKKQFETKFNQEINRLKKHLQEIEKEMRVTLEQLGKELEETNTKLILLYLEQGKIPMACSTFKDKLNLQHSRTNINAIVKIAIGKELGTNISMENVVKFTQGLTDDAEAMAHGAIRLFQILEHKQALDVPTVHILHGAVGNIIGSCKSLEGTDFETLKLILDEDTVDRVIQVFNKLEFLIKNVQLQLQYLKIS